MSKKEIVIQSEPRTNSTRAKFRKLSRDVCREVFDVPENNKVIFVYEKHYSKTTHIGCISYQLSDLSMTTPANSFDDDFYNLITFLFVKIDFQRGGIGKLLLEEAIKDVRAHDKKRPIRVQSAGGAVGFFEKMGFSKIGDMMETVCGVSMFRNIQNMEQIVGNTDDV